MKRKKLLLHRETLRALGQTHLARVAGRGDTFEIVTGCACTDGCGSGGCGSGGCGSGGCGSGGCGSGGCGTDTCTCIDPPSFCFC